MKNLLLTGGAGFIGSNFIRYLLEEQGFRGRIINLDKLTYAGNLESLRGIPEKFPHQYIFCQGDICDYTGLEEIFNLYEIDSICHFAAESHVDRSITQAGQFIQTNIVGTFNLLELAKKNQKRIHRFHHVSTDEVFGSLGKEGLFTEDSPYQPNSPYSASKASSDHLVRAYHQTYGLPVTLSNCSNNYGPYQFPEKLIPLMILNAWEGKELPVYGDGQHVRDWLFVRDHCRALALILEQGVPGETYNVGGRSEKSNLHVVETLCDLLDRREALPDGQARRSLIRFVKDRPGHDRRYAIDDTKIREDLGWKPEENFESGLEKTIQWYLDNKEWVAHVQSGEHQKWLKEQYG
ncbi:MAG: dTDP-glucose 4,6-dehydratase [bacterium]|nr:dTDP-glucose 4,6-dehydratase [bacterium]